MPMATQLDQDLEIYDDSSWASKRAEYQEYYNWYDGTNLDVEIKGKKDQFTGEKLKLWPLELNPIAKFCRVHRAVLMGMQPDVSALPIRTLVNREGLSDEQRDQAQAIENFIADTWYWSSGPSRQMEMGLLLQIHGGHILQVAWEPYNDLLPNRIGIISHKSPANFYPVAYNPSRPSELLECYVGYEIEAKVAKLQFGITPKDESKKVLYLEHWTRTEYWIHVDGQVPIFKRSDKKQTKFRLEGEHSFGVVPVVYIPHELDGGYYGRSLIDGPSALPGLTKEINSRVADKGDMMRDSKPVPTVRNIQGSLEMRSITNGGSPIMDVVDLGNKPMVSNAGDPELDIKQSGGIPQSIADFPSELQNLALQQADVAPVAVGEDDVSGGRITGPVTAYRMWPTMQHTMTERLNVSEGVLQIARIALRIASNRQSNFSEVGVQPPTLPREPWTWKLQTSWYPMIPIERAQKVEELMNLFREGAISVDRLLDELGVPDKEEEARRIWEDRKLMADLEAKAKMSAFEQAGGSSPRGAEGGTRE